MECFSYKSQVDKVDAETGNIPEYGFEESNKKNYGVYKIDGSTFEIQSWLPTKSCHKIQFTYGEIINDTILKINTIIDSDVDETIIVNSQFKFVPFNFKPDSIHPAIP